MLRNALDLYLSERLAAHLGYDEDDRLVFTYTDGWTADTNAYPLSLALPLHRERHDPQTALNVLRGLIPENQEVLLDWHYRYGIHNIHDPLSVLHAVGMDVAGAAQFVPAGTELEQSSTLAPISDAEIAELIHDTRETGGSTPYIEKLPRVSLAGQQAKFALHKHADGWMLPQGRTPSTHIFKPAGRKHPDIDHLEVALLRAARTIGITAVGAEVLTFEHEPVFVTERYDRRKTPDGVGRIHQEDFAQALGLSPRQKYQTDHGATLPQLVQLIRDNSIHPERDLREFLALTAFNVAVGNTDAHAKNHSFLIHPGGEVELAPAYDIISIAPYPGYSKELAFAIGGAYQYRAIEAAHWRKFARTANLDEDQVLDVVEQVWENAPDAVMDALRNTDASKKTQHLIGETMRNTTARHQRLLDSRTSSTSSPNQTTAAGSAPHANTSVDPWASIGPATATPHTAHDPSTPINPHSL